MWISLLLSRLNFFLERMIYIKELIINDQITAKEVQVIDQNAQSLGTKSINEALMDIILNKLNNLSNNYTFVMDEKGKQYTSTELADKFNKITTNGNSNITFIIGGSLGLAESIKTAGNELLSFSKLTFPHQMIRMFLLEQIFRVFKINNNETYHH